MAEGNHEAETSPGTSEQQASIKEPLRPPDPIVCTTPQDVSRFLRLAENAAHAALHLNDAAPHATGAIGGG